MRKQLLQDLIAAASAAYPLPAFDNEAATTTWVGTFAQSATHVVYDVVLKDPVVASDKLKACCESLATPYTDEEIEEAYHAMCASGKCKAALGVDLSGLLGWLKGIPWSQVIAMILALIQPK